MTCLLRWLLGPPAYANGGHVWIHPTARPSERPVPHPPRAGR